MTWEDELRNPAFANIEALGGADLLRLLIVGDWPPAAGGEARLATGQAVKGESSMMDTSTLGVGGTHNNASRLRSVCNIGGSGFIGTRLTRDLCARGNKVRILDIVEPKLAGDGLDIEYRRADVRNKTALEAAMANCETIVNLAAAHRDDVRPRRLYDEINVEGARNVCEAAEVNGIDTILFTSSVAVYGTASENANEMQPHCPCNDYGRTKSEAERVYVSWHARNSSGRRLVIVRPTVVFGPGNRGNVYTLLSQVAAGRFLMVGDGSNRKSMAYVDNVSGFISHVLNGPPGIHMYNYVDKPDLSMNELVSLVRASLDMHPRVSVTIPYWLAIAIGCSCDALAFATRRSLPVSRVRIEKFCANTVFSADRAFTQTDFLPPVPLHIGLRQTIAADFR
jgi:nucleoside-diphosphate-sugar epimerase